MQLSTGRYRYRSRLRSGDGKKKQPPESRKHLSHNWQGVCAVSSTCIRWQQSYRRIYGQRATVSTRKPRKSRKPAHLDVFANNESVRFTPEQAEQCRKQCGLLEDSAKALREYWLNKEGSPIKYSRRYKPKFVGRANDQTSTAPDFIAMYSRPLLKDLNRFAADWYVTQERSATVIPENITDGRTNSRPVNRSINNKSGEAGESIRKQLEKIKQSAVRVGDTLAKLPSVFQDRDVIFFSCGRLWRTVDELIHPSSLQADGAKSPHFPAITTFEQSTPPVGARDQNLVYSQHNKITFSKRDLRKLLVDLRNNCNALIETFNKFEATSEHNQIACVFWDMILEEGDVADLLIRIPVLINQTSNRIDQIDASVLAAKDEIKRKKGRYVEKYNAHQISANNARQLVEDSLRFYLDWTDPDTRFYKTKRKGFRRLVYLFRDALNVGVSDRALTEKIKIKLDAERLNTD